MKLIVSIAVACLATTCAGLLVGYRDRFEHPEVRLIGWTVSGMLLVIAGGLLVSRFDRRSNAWLRFDWFLPELRRVRRGESPNRRWLSRFATSWLPDSWGSRHETKQRGKVRRLLRRFGNSWLASPIRRVVQTICLVVFLASFFYVCWPYRARPDEPGRVSSGWHCVGIDQQSGRFLFQHDGPDDWVVASGPVFLRRDATSPAYVMDVAPGDSESVELMPPESFPDELFDLLLTEDRGWSLYEREPDAWPTHYADELARSEWLPADLFLVLDPLVSLSTAIASRSWVWSLTIALAILIVCLLVPRGFCGYLCPLGTTIDLFDWAVGSRVERFRVASEGWWVHIKYYLLAATLIAAAMGILVSGMVSAIPVITRAALFIGEPLQSGTLRGWHLVPAPNVGQLLSVALFAGVLCLGLLRPRFWCKYVCPSGAVFSLGNLFRITERKVESSCIHCNKCVEICPFDAIKPDFTTRGTDCTLCQSCGGVCPTHAIKFVERWNVVELKVDNDPPTRETSLGRRGFLSLAGGGVAAVVGGTTAAMSIKSLGANLGDPDAYLPVRPPGSVPEQAFLEMCIRCGECFKVCPNNVLQPLGFEQGLEGLWTPRVEANWAGCESSCNACGQVCPTGAIRALPMEEKRVARMGLAIVNASTCLPMALKEDCDLCVQECIAAGYRAIEYIQVGTEVDEAGLPVEGSGKLAPVVLEDKCVGCGLCQTRCYAINVKDRGVLDASAIIVEAGEGREDRLVRGSYRELRRRESADSSPTLQPRSGEAVPPETSTGEADPARPQSQPAEFENPFSLRTQPLRKMKYAAPAMHIEAQT